LGAAARTAVIAGTATAVSRGVNNSLENTARHRQQATQNAREQSQAELEQIKAQLAAMQEQQLVTDQTRAIATTASPDLTVQLQQLACLKEAGALTDEEFQAAKTKLLR
jgi:hypothetical protein